MSREQTVRILFVDDELSVLNALRRNLVREAFEPLYTHSGAGALAALDERRIDILVADLRMPHMDGVQLLEAVRRKHPDVVRLVLSASSDVNRILDAINKGEVFRFIVKPIADMEAFRNTIGQAVAQVLLARRAREADRLKAEFMASMTHELRSPLASIKGFAETLLHGCEMDAATRQEFLKAVVSESARLMQLVTSVLDISRIEAGGFTLTLMPTDLGLLMEETVESMRREFDAKAITLRAETSATVPAMPADRERVIQVLRNLLDNALKYTAEGGEVRVSLSVDEESAVMRVADNGCGIDAEDLPRVCEKFYRGRQRGARIGGAGLGLAVAKEIVARHGWELRIESQPARGTTVAITVPRAAAGAGEDVLNGR